MHLLIEKKEKEKEMLDLHLGSAQVFFLGPAEQKSERKDKKNKCWASIWAQPTVFYGPSRTKIRKQK